MTVSLQMNYYERMNFQNLKHFLLRCHQVNGIKAYTCTFWRTELSFTPWADENRYLWKYLSDRNPEYFMKEATKVGLGNALRHHLQEHRRRLIHDNLFKKYVDTSTDSIVTATRTGRMQLVQDMLKKDPRLLNKAEDGMTIVYHAAFCGHANLLRWLLEQGGAADWDRTYINSCDRIRPIIKVHSRRDIAARCIQKHLHNWLWKPVTNDGKRGINARLLLRDLNDLMTPISNIT